MWRHGLQRGIAHALIEIRQDLIRDGAGQAAWAERLARILEALLVAASPRSSVAHHAPTVCVRMEMSPCRKSTRT
jgi:predicted N-formylglutamate amidohydrolase